MTWQDGLAHLEGLSPSHIKMGLDRVVAALARLGNPQLRVPALHVAGTNGKGSTCALAASCLRTRYRTGLYTSPHLVRPNERIQIDGVEIDDEMLGRRVVEIVEVLGPAHELTYFELGTLVAFWHFAQEQVDVAVLETGLGGRLDATTACVPRVTCITPIDLDHQAYLGTTLRAIAGEKAGIVKPAVPLVSARQQPEVLVVLEAAAYDRLALEGRDFEVVAQPDGRWMYRGRQVRWTDLELHLLGPHQRQNLAVALACLEALTDFPLTAAQVEEGVRTARWPGRLERFEGQPLVLLDGAHNPAGVRALLAALDEDFAGRPVHLVFGVFADKDFEPMVRALFPRAARVHLTPLSSPRSKDPRAYEVLARSLSPEVVVHPNAAAALLAACEGAPHDAVVVVAGSLVLVGELRPGLVALTVGR